MKNLKAALGLVFWPVTLTVVLLFWAGAEILFFFERVWRSIQDRLARRKRLATQLFFVRLPKEEFERALKEFRADSIARGYSAEEMDKTIRLLREQKLEAGDVV